MALLLCDVLKESAKKNPHKIAIEENNRTISYEELYKLSKKMASCLLASGALKKDRIGVYADKSIETIASIFGILQAGCVYVPLDINLSPKEFRPDHK